MEVCQVTGTLGAVVQGLDLEHITDSEFGELHEALMRHQVLFARDQELSERGQRALAARFGVPTTYPLSKQRGETDFLHQIEDTAESPPKADSWHMDVTWIEHPPDVGILYALVVPAFGGDTMWADLYGAWEQLSAPAQAMLEPLQVLHVPDDLFWKRVNDPIRERELREAFPGAVHPLVRQHPVTGRTLLNLAGYFMDSIVGMTPEESEWLLEWLQSRVDDPNLQLRWSWRAGDVAIWDERSVVHRALSDHYPQHRKMRRCIINRNGRR